MHEDKLDRFFGIPNHRFSSVHFLDSNGRETVDDHCVDHVVIELTRTSGPFRCPCGRRFQTVHDHRDRFIRDLPWGPWKVVELLVPRFRVNCPDCGVRTEALDWLVPNCGYTRRLADLVALACREVRAISEISRQFCLSWDVVCTIDKRRLEAELNPPSFAGLRFLAMDEIAIRKGHSYATVFLDCERNRVVWMCEGRDKKSVKAVFRDVFGPDVCAGIEAVAMDFWSPFETAVKKHAPQAKIVWDFFHIVKNYNKKVVDAVRLEEARKYKTSDRSSYTAIKRSKWILLRNPEKLTEPAKLTDLLKANRRLLVAHVMREQLSEVWKTTDPKKARELILGWVGRAKRSKVRQLRNFAMALKNKLQGIINHSTHKLNTSILEGVNNKIKVIKRVAYGFRDMAYFFLKVRGHFSAIHIRS